MIRFTYTARNKTGEKVSGTVDAENRTDAIRKIEGMSCVPVSVHAENPAASTPPATQQRSANAVALVAVLVGVFFVGFFAIISSYESESSRTPQSATLASDQAQRSPNIKREPKKEFSDVMNQSIRNSVAERWRSTEQAQPRSEYPNVLSVLAILYEGEGFLDTGKYSRDQQEQIFSDRFMGNKYFVYGQISDVGKSVFGGQKYITIMVTEGHYFDVYPVDDFDLLAYAKGQRIGFIGTWTSLGTGIMIKHKIERATSPTNVEKSASSTQSNQPATPYDQHQFALQIKGYTKQYQDIAKLGNDINLDSFAKITSAYLEAPRQISGWIGKANGVNVGIFNDTWIDVTHDEIEYVLRPSTSGGNSQESLLNQLQKISRGSLVKFTGTLNGSTRLTKRGAILDPQFRVELYHISLIDTSLLDDKTPQTQGGRELILNFNNEQFRHLAALYSDLTGTNIFMTNVDYPNVNIVTPERVSIEHALRLIDDFMQDNGIILVPISHNEVKAVMR